MKKLCLIFTIIIPFIISNPSFAEPSCDLSKGSSKLATANTWENLRNNKGSLKFETAEILKCGLPNLPLEKMLIISSLPKIFLSEYDDKTYCQSKLSETKKSPYIYNAGSFSSVEDLNDWIKDFSQGSGKDGKDLYAKCDKSCSPQYTYKIKKSGEDNLTLNAEVICGDARDKNDNMYVLKASLN